MHCICKYNDRINWKVFAVHYGIALSMLQLRWGTPHTAIRNRDNKLHSALLLVKLNLFCCWQNVEGKSTTSGAASHHLPGFGAPVANRGPLEPPKITKPWSLSCLRPAPPLKPSAALGYKEVTVISRSNMENSHKSCEWERNSPALGGPDRKPMHTQGSLTVIFVKQGEFLSSQFAVPSVYYLYNVHRVSEFCARCTLIKCMYIHFCFPHCFLHHIPVSIFSHTSSFSPFSASLEDVLYPEGKRSRECFVCVRDSVCVLG